MSKKEEMKCHKDTNVRWVCQYDWEKAIKLIPPKERYRICCQLIGKDKTDAFLKDLAKHPLKRWLWKLKRLKRKYLK